VGERVIGCNPIKRHVNPFCFFALAGMLLSIRGMILVPISSSLLAYSIIYLFVSPHGEFSISPPACKLDSRANRFNGLDLVENYDIMLRRAQVWN